MRNYKQDGAVISVIAPYTVSTGDGVQVGSLFGMAAHPAKIGEGLGIVPRGVVSVIKPLSEAWSQGQPVFWNNTTRAFTTGSAGMLIGLAAEGASNTVTAGSVVLQPSGGAVSGITDPVTGRIRFSAGEMSADGGLAEYEGIVATGGATMTATLVSFGSKSAYSRAVAYAKSDLSEIAAVWGNFYVQSGTGEVAGSGSFTLEASIEYPLGTFTRLTFGGSNSVTCAAGALVKSDAASVVIPDGAKFWVRQYFTSSSGAMHYLSADGIADTMQGESFDHSTGTLANNVMSGAMTDGGGGTIIMRPLALVGPTTKPSWIIYGDSRQAGTLDQLSNGKGLRGELARTIGQKYGYSNCSCAGAYASQFVSLSARQRTLLQYATHVACGYGINDLNGGWDAGTVQATLQALHALVAGDGRKVYQTTFAPALVTSSDSYATVANQTADPHNAARITVNAWVRSIPAPLTDIFDTAHAVESARDAGKWKAPGYTADGTHGGRLANEETAKVVNI